MFIHRAMGTFCLSLVMITSMQCAPSNQLQKIFHHKVSLDVGASMKDVPFLELGKVMFAFASEPTIEVQKPSEDTQRERLFFFPTAMIADAECESMVKALQAQRSPFYSLKISVVTKPVPGLLFSIRMTSDDVGVNYSLLEANGSMRRIVFTMYNKTLVKKIDDAHAQILRTAHHDGKPLVVVDCGHGGQDFGAIGCFGLQEKEVNLAVGECLSTLLREKGFAVVLTRSDDTFVPLDERTHIHDNEWNASLFVSIHSNAAANTQARGVETFFFDVSRYCKGVDAQATNLLAVMHDRCVMSQCLAQAIHESVLAQVRTVQSDVIDRQVKPLFLQVLAGAAVPAALIELGFLTNEYEAHLIKDKKYQRLLALGICEGIMRYVEAAKVSVA